MTAGLVWPSHSSSAASCRRRAPAPRTHHPPPPALSKPPPGQSSCTPHASHAPSHSECAAPPTAATTNGILLVTEATLVRVAVVSRSAPVSFNFMSVSLYRCTGSQLMSVTSTRISSCCAIRYATASPRSRRAMETASGLCALDAAVSALSAPPSRRSRRRRRPRRRPSLRSPRRRERRDPTGHPGAGPNIAIQAMTRRAIQAPARIWY